MPRKTRVKSVFLNIPYDAAFEDLFLAYIVGLTQLGLRINIALAVPNQGRLETIIELIERSDFSIHDLSRVELYHGLPRFNMNSVWLSTGRASRVGNTEFLSSIGSEIRRSVPPVT